MPFGPGDIDLPTLPVFLLHSLAGGATCVIADANLGHVGKINPEPVIAQMIRERVTSSSGSPAFFQRIADYLHNTNTTIPTIRDLYMGGARVPASLVQKLTEQLPDASIHVVYGSTEAEPIAVLDAKKHLDTLLTTSSQGALVGEPVEHIHLRIDGSPYGEILVSGRHVNTGYVDNPEAEKSTKIREDDTVWHRTGDIGHLDAKGQLWLVGRAGESVGGLWPLAVEGAAESFPFVVRSGLVEMNNEPLLAVQLQSPPEKWKKTLEKATGTPVIAIPEIPVDARHNAKVDRVLLKKLLRG